MPTARSEVALWRWRASRNCAEHRKRCWMAVLAFAPSATGCFSGARSVRSTTPQSTRHQKIFRKRALTLGLIVATPYDLRLPFFRGSFHGNRSDGLGGSSFRCGHRIRRGAMLLQGIDGRRTEGGDRHGMPARRYQRGDKKSPRVLDTRSAYHHNRQFSTEGCPSG